MKISKIAIALAWLSLVTLPAEGKGVAEPGVWKVSGKAFSSIKKVEDGGDRGDCLKIDGNILYCCGMNTLRIFDVTKADEPRLLGSCLIKGRSRQVTSNAGMVYIGSRETGLWIIDARNPSEPKVIRRYDAVELATGVDVVGNLLLIGLRQNGVEFVDVSDPYNPAHIFLQKTPESQSVWYHDGMVYSGEWGKGQVTVIDASDLSNINVIGKVPLNGYGDGICSNGKYLFAATGHNSKDPGLSKKENEGMGHALEVIDISDPANPVSLSRIQFEQCYKRGYFDFWTARPNGDNTICFVADTFNGLYAVDVRNPRRPGIIGRVVFGAGDEEISPVTSVAVGDGVVYATSANSGLFVLKCKKARKQVVDRGRMPENLSCREPYNTSPDSRFTAWKPSSRAQVRSAATRGDVVFAACSDAGLAILRQASDGSLQQVGKGKAAFAGDVKVLGNRLFVAEGLDGLAIYEIKDECGLVGSKDECGLVEIKRIRKIRNDIDWCLWVWALSGDYVAASGRYGGVSVIDISNLEKPVTVSSFSVGAGWDRYLPQRLCEGNVLPYLKANKALCWLKIGDKKPFYVDERNGGSLMNGVCNYKNGTIISSKSGELRFVEPGRKYDSPARSFKLGIKISGAPQWDGANLVSVTSRIGKKIVLVDLSDDNAPRILFEEDTAGEPETPTFFKGKLLVPCGYQGLLLQK